MRLGRVSRPRSTSLTTAEGEAEAAFLGVGFESPRDQVANPGVDGRAPDLDLAASTAVRWRRAERAVQLIVQDLPVFYGLERLCLRGGGKRERESRRMSVVLDHGGAKETEI